MELVLDASVVIKWFLEEKSSKEALRYRQQHLEGKISLVAPALLPFEIVNALCTKTKTKLPTILEAIEVYKFTGITEYFLTEKLAQAAATLSKNYKISAYDAAYVALAQDLGCQFITADKKLYRKVKSSKFVKFLE
jgi:predicted nucleic acid-binding protein